MSKIKESMVEHPFFKDFKASHLELLAECSSHVHFNKGSYLFREGETADWLYLIREGKVVVETQMPGRDPLAIMTIGKGGVVGWSWLFPPYRWHFGARVIGCRGHCHGCQVRPRQVQRRLRNGVRFNVAVRICNGRAASGRQAAVAECLQLTGISGRKCSAMLFTNGKRFLNVGVLEMSATRLGRILQPR